jgi:hypothetical protein
MSEISYNNQLYLTGNGITYGNRILTLSMQNDDYEFFQTGLNLTISASKGSLVNFYEAMIASRHSAITSNISGSELSSFELAVIENGVNSSISCRKMSSGVTSCIFSL